ncbi:MAG: hypothetical protein B6I37_08060 [Desulfobacteraceae bacterium 4572_35.2]|nr:MAG: hypothetical protein B6I37_08060 [Desulfobacteraceae bacterium 4572_35.2]
MNFTRIIVLVLLLLSPFCAYADDVDLYGVSGIGEDMLPNVLIILDNSGSMSTEDVPGDAYNPEITYSGDYSSNKVYKKTSSWSGYFNDITSSDWRCDEAKEALLSSGYWRGGLNRDNGIVTCGSGDKKYRLGNYRNFLKTGSSERSRMAVAKEIVAELIHKNFANVNFGLMAFNTGNSTYGFSDYYGNGGYIIAECGASVDSLIGNFEIGDTMSMSSITDYGSVGKLFPQTNTPLAETLAEAGLYFAGKQSWFNGTTTNSTSYPLGRYSVHCTDSNNYCQDYSNDTPIEYRCQKNYIIVVTDGEPTKDDDKFASQNYINNQKLTEIIDGNTSYLDDVAAFLNSQDLLPNMGSAGDFPDQTVTTFTIGFKTDQDLLQSTATRGGGEYYTADSAAELGESLSNILTTISNHNEMFTASSVPVSTADGIFSGNYIYLGLFQPITQNNWVGNLKKFGISSDGTLLDKTGNVASNASGTIFENAVSFWSTSGDGPNVTAGGAGEILQERQSDRMLYTYTGSNTTLSDSSNAFTTENSILTTETDADPPGYGLTTETIISAHRGISDDWTLGSLLHFQPIVEHYDIDNDGNYDGSGDKSVIFAGGNDGILHCFDDDTGEELWGFIPQDLLTDLSSLNAPDDLVYFVDGNGVVYSYDDDDNATTADKKLLLFGERRGGYSYTALDISSYNAPSFKYTIEAGHLAVENEILGQSWGEPQLCTMGVTQDSTYTTKDVFLLPGGYDTNQDKDTPSEQDAVGRAVFSVDAQTGELFSNCLFSHTSYAAMTHSIIAAAAYPNPNTETSTRIYAGDLDGNFFAFRDDIFHRNQDANKKGDFEGLYDGQEDGVWEQKIKLFSAEGKKIWYAPAAVNEYVPVTFTYPASEIGSTTAEVRTEYRVGEYVYFGTGDRSRPNETETVNILCAIKNNWQWSSDSPTLVKAYVDINDEGTVKAIEGNLPIEDSELFLLDVTDDLIQSGSTNAATYVTTALNKGNNRGWFLNFVESDGSSVGEKIVSSPVIYMGVVMFTTFVPAEGEEDNSETYDPCSSPGSSGTGRFYAINYKTAAAVFNLNKSNDQGDEEVIDREDRHFELSKSGIPPGTTLYSDEDKTLPLVGVQPIPPASFTNPVERMYWRQINRD